MADEGVRPEPLSFGEPLDKQLSPRFGELVRLAGLLDAGVGEVEVGEG